MGKDAISVNLERPALNRGGQLRHNPSAPYNTEQSSGLSTRVHNWSLASATTIKKSGGGSVSLLAVNVPQEVIYPVLHSSDAYMTFCPDFQVPKRFNKFLDKSPTSEAH